LRAITGCHSDTVTEFLKGVNPGKVRKQVKLAQLKEKVEAFNSELPTVLADASPQELKDLRSDIESLRKETMRKRDEERTISKTKRN
jgi:hypothetical protein